MLEKANVTIYLQRRQMKPNENDIKKWPILEVTEAEKDNTANLDSGRLTGRYFW